MRIPSIPMIVFWIVMVAAPLLVCAVVVGQVPDVEQVPLHWNAAGEIDRWGSPDELTGICWFLGAVMAGSNLLMAVLYVFNDALYNSGLVHGVSRSGALKLYAVLAVVLVVTTAAIVVGITANVIAAV